MATKHFYYNILQSNPGLTVPIVHEFVSTFNDARPLSFAFERSLKGLSVSAFFLHTLPETTATKQP